MITGPPARGRDLGVRFARSSAWSLGRSLSDRGRCVQPDIPTAVGFPAPFSPRPVSRKSEQSVVYETMARLTFTRDVLDDRKGAHIGRTDHGLDHLEALSSSARAVLFKSRMVRIPPGIRQPWAQELCRTDPNRQTLSRT